MTSPMGTFGLTLRRLRHPDHQTLVRLEAFDREAFGPAGLRTWDLAMVAEAGAVYMALLDEELVGACQLIRVLDEPRYCYVVGLYVRPAWQGTGLGRQVLGEVARECRKMDIEGLLLTVAPGNAKALNLYRSAGFVEEAFVPQFYGEGEDRHLLRWRFGEKGLRGSV